LNLHLNFIIFRKEINILEETEKMELYLLFGLNCGFCGLVGFLLFTRKIWNGKSKIHDDDENPNKMECMIPIIEELKIKSSNHSMDIDKLYLENCELRSKLDKIYCNHLTENINYYKNIVLMNEKIEYMQKYMLHRCNLHTK
jgi:ArsR family metal-binding transcriptional regulator